MTGLKIGAVLAAALTLGACAGTTAPQASAPTVQLSDKERLVAAIEGNGCVINAGTIGGILADASINQNDLAPLVVELETEGRLAPDGETTVRLSSNNCI